MSTHCHYPSYFLDIFLPKFHNMDFQTFFYLYSLSTVFGADCLFINFEILRFFFLELKYSCWQVLRGNQLWIVIAFFAFGCVGIRFTQAPCYWYSSTIKSAMFIPRICTDCTRRTSRVGEVHCWACRMLQTLACGGGKWV